MIGQIVSLLLTPYGMFTFMIGFLLFFFLPMVPRITGIFHRLAHLHQWLGARMVKRGGIVISEHGDLLLKRMSPTDIGTEEIEFGDETKEFEDPHEAKSSWMGIGFTFADEAHGILFSLKDCAVGRRKKEARETDRHVIRGTAKEGDEYGIMGWVKALYEFPKDTYELVNLNHVRHLMTGNERAEHPQRVETYYRHSRSPYASGASTVRVILILAALLLPFGVAFFAWNQVASSNTGGGSTIIGVLWFLLAGPNIKEWWSNLDHDAIQQRMMHGLKTLLVVGPLPVIFGLLGYYVGWGISVSLFVIFAIGFIVPILFIELLRFSETAANTLAPKLLKMGFLAYDEPVWVETPRGYTIREYRTLDNVDTQQVVWHTLLGRKMGFTFEPSPNQWGTELADPDNVEARTVDSTDSKSNLPADAGIVEERQRAETYGSWVPKRLRRNHYYLWSGIALHRYAHAATGQKTFKKLEKAKEDYGEEEDEQKSLVRTVAATGFVSLLLAIGLFFFVIGV